MDQSHRLIVPILDALSNFIIQEDYMCKIRETVFDQLESADLEDLPLIIKFLLQTATLEDAFIVCFIDNFILTNFMWLKT
jgi:Fanconi anemia group D2 protein